MAATLSAVFKGVDEISAVFEKMASSGARAVDQWDSANKTASTAFTQAQTGADAVAKAMTSAASSTDTWTSAIGSYDKSAMEAIYTTEELVKAGYKTEEALFAEARAAAQATDEFEKSLKVTVKMRNRNSFRLVQVEMTFEEPP